MKKTLFIALTSMLLSCTCTLKAEQVTQNREVSNFTGIDAREGIIVNIVMGQEASVKVTASDKYIDELLTEVENGSLVIHWSKKMNFKGRSATVDVVATDLNRIVSSSGATVKSGTITTATLAAAASSGARIEIDSLSVSKVDAKSSSGASIVMSGKAERAELDASSGARIKGTSFTAGNATASASSGASVSLNVTDNFSASASSGGSVRYGGKPQITDVNASSGGGISKL